MTAIKVQIKQVYGRDTIYPICDTAKIFAEFANLITLRKEDIKRIKQLGYSVEVVRGELGL